MTCGRAISITGVYDQRDITAVTYRCAGCGQTWDHLPLAAALRAKTSSPFDRECEKHWRSCPATQENP